MRTKEEIRAFRLKRASELEQFAAVIRKLGICDPHPLETAAKQLKDSNYTPKIDVSDDVNYEYWGYSVGDLVFYFTDLPRHTHPTTTTNLSLTLSVRLIADISDFEKIKDPYKHLEVNIVVAGSRQRDGKTIELITSYHLDRHLVKKGDAEPEAAHPIYHFQFGGRKLNKTLKDFGNALILDSPRIVHYPMDLILSIDFVLSNFFPNKWRLCRKDGDYINIVRQCQHLFWKPYAYAKAYNWKPYSEIGIDWKPLTIWPQLI